MTDKEVLREVRGRLYQKYGDESKFSRDMINRLGKIIDKADDTKIIPKREEINDAE